MADEQDKTEQPTQHRLQEARKRGQVARSSELTGIVVTIAFSIALAVSSRDLAGALAGTVRRMLLMAGNAPAPSAGLWHWLAGAMAPSWQALLPVVMVLPIAAVLGNLVQTGPTFSTTPVKPDMSRLNPVEGFKKIASLRTVWELLKLLLKMALLGALAWSLAGSVDRATQAAALASPANMGGLLRRTYVDVTWWMLALLLLLALFDLWFVRREFTRKMRMSRRDIKDEYKERDGDPDIRQKRKRLMAELVKQARSVRRVPDADIVVTNPTHLAVALKYRPRTMHAPVVLAKGADAVAARIRQSAAVATVPCLRSPSLARALFRQCRVDQAVPAELFDQLAPVYRWLMQRPGNRIFS